MPEWRAEISERLAGARLSPADEADITEELKQHLDDRYEDLRRRGLGDADARRGALAELGEHDHLQHRLRTAVTRRRAPVSLGGGETRGGVDGLWNDLRIGARMLRRTPGFTVVAALTLALGIGANTTIFSIVNTLLLRPLPGLARPDELVLIGRTQDGEGFDTFSYPDFADYRRESRTLAGVAAHYAAAVHLSTGGASDRVRAEVVSDNYFAVLGVRPAIGRLFLGERDAPLGGAAVAVLGYAFWQRRFGGDSAIVGRVVQVNAHPYTVVGVAAAPFQGLELDRVIDLFVPLAMIAQVSPGFTDALTERGAVWLQLFGRLSSGSLPPAAEAELRGIARRLEQEYPKSNAKRGVAVAAGLGFDPESRREVRTFTGILLGVVGLVLLIACANVANLLLARGAARQKELSIRASLGASRTRLIRQLLAEGFLLAGIGGAAGLFVGVWALRLVLRLPLFAGSPPTVAVFADPRVLAFTASVSVLSAIVFGLPSAYRASRVDLVSSLKAGAPGSAGGGTVLRSGLLVAQLAISLVLLVATGLFVRTLLALYAVEPGFATKRVLVATVDVALQGYDEARGRRFYADLERGAAGLPGVRDAALAYMLPLGGGGWDTRIFPAETQPAEEDPGLKTDVNTVSVSYFRTVSMPIVRGRGFTDADRLGAPAVAVVNDVVAEKLWPGVDPVGKRFRMGRKGEPLEVVGILRTAKYRSLLEPARPFLYRPFAQVYQSPMTIHVNVAGDPRTLVEPLRRLVTSLDKDLPVYRVQTLAERLDQSVSSQRTAATLVGVYGMLALLLAAVGLYGSMAYLVSRRTREIGIRMALGARSAVVLRQVLREALQLAALGATLGLLLAVPAARLLRSQLFGVGPMDPLTLAIVPVVLAAVAVAAAYLPARRATRVDPVVALRME
jgi:predicted permease